MQAAETGSSQRTTKQRVFWKGVRELPGGRKGGASAPRRPGTSRQPLLEVPTGECRHPSASPPTDLLFFPFSKIQSSHPATTGTSHVTQVGDSQGHFGTVKERTRRASVYPGRDRCPQKPEQRLPLLGTQGPRWSEGGTGAVARHLANPTRLRVLNLCVLLR